MKKNNKLFLGPASKIKIFKDEMSFQFNLPSAVGSGMTIRVWDVISPSIILDMVEDSTEITSIEMNGKFKQAEVFVAESTKEDAMRVGAGFAERIDKIIIGIDEIKAKKVDIFKKNDLLTELLEENIHDSYRNST